MQTCTHAHMHIHLYSLSLSRARTHAPSSHAHTHRLQIAAAGGDDETSSGEDSDSEEEAPNAGTRGNFAEHGALKSAVAEAEAPCARHESDRTPDRPDAPQGGNVSKDDSEKVLPAAPSSQTPNLQARNCGNVGAGGAQTSSSDASDTDSAGAASSRSTAAAGDGIGDGATPSDDKACVSEDKDFAAGSPGEAGSKKMDKGEDFQRTWSSDRDGRGGNGVGGSSRRRSEDLGRGSQEGHDGGRGSSGRGREREKERGREGKGDGEKRRESSYSAQSKDHDKIRDGERGRRDRDRSRERDRDADRARDRDRPTAKERERQRARDRQRPRDSHSTEPERGEKGDRGLRRDGSRERDQRSRERDKERDRRSDERDGREHDRDRSSLRDGRESRRDRSSQRSYETGHRRDGTRDEERDGEKERSSRRECAVCLKRQESEERRGDSGEGLGWEERKRPRREDVVDVLDTEFLQAEARKFKKQADEQKHACPLKADFCYFKSAVYFFECFYLQKNALALTQTAGQFRHVADGVKKNLDKYLDARQLDAPAKALVQEKADVLHALALKVGAVAHMSSLRLGHKAKVKSDCKQLQSLLEKHLHSGAGAGGAGGSGFLGGPPIKASSTTPPFEGLTPPDSVGSVSQDAPVMHLYL